MSRIVKNVVAILLLICLCVANVCTFKGTLQSVNREQENYGMRDD